MILYYLNLNFNKIFQSVNIDFMTNAVYNFAKFLIYERYMQNKIDDCIVKDL